jgi:hypothetical protein
VIIFLSLLSCGGNQLSTKPRNNNEPKINLGALPITQKNADGSYLIKESYDAISPIDFNSLVFPDFSSNLIITNNSLLDKVDLKLYLDALIDIMKRKMYNILPYNIQKLLIDMSSVSLDVKQYNDVEEMAQDLDQIKNLHDVVQIPIKKIASQVRAIKSLNLPLDDSLRRARKIISSFYTNYAVIRGEDQITFIDFWANSFLDNIICADENSVNWLYKEKDSSEPFFNAFSSSALGHIAINRMITSIFNRIYKGDKQEDLAIMNYIWVIAYGIKEDFKINSAIKSDNKDGKDSKDYYYDKGSLLDNQLDKLISMISSMSKSDRKKLINSLLKELENSSRIPQDTISNIEIGSNLFYRIALSASFATSPERFSEEEENRLISLLKQLLSNPYDEDVEQLVFNFGVGYFFKHNFSDNQIIEMMIDLGLKKHITNLSFNQEFFKNFKEYSLRLENLKNEILNNK